MVGVTHHPGQAGEVILQLIIAADDFVYLNLLGFDLSLDVQSKVDQMFAMLLSAAESVQLS